MNLRLRFVVGRFLLVLAVGLSPWPGQQPLAGEPAVKKVIVLIADECSAEQYTSARRFQGNKPLALDAIRAGSLETYIADSVIADSAPAATAFASGYRMSDKSIGNLP